MSINASMATEAEETKEGFILSAIRYKAGCVGGVQQLSEVEKTDLQAQARRGAAGCTRLHVPAAPRLFVSSCSALQPLQTAVTQHHTCTVAAFMQQSRSQAQQLQL